MKTAKPHSKQPYRGASFFVIKKLRLLSRMCVNRPEAHIEKQAAPALSAPRGHHSGRAGTGPPLATGWKMDGVGEEAQEVVGVCEGPPGGSLVVDQGCVQTYFLIYSRPTARNFCLLHAVRCCKT